MTLIRENLEKKSKDELIDLVIYSEGVFQAQKKIIDELTDKFEIKKETITIKNESENKE